MQAVYGRLARQAVAQGRGIGHVQRVVEIRLDCDDEPCCCAWSRWAHRLAIRGARVFFPQTRERECVYGRGAEGSKLIYGEQMKPGLYETLEARFAVIKGRKARA